MTLVLTVLILLVTPFYAIAEKWSYIGPDGGAVSQIAPDRNNPDLWYAIVGGQPYISRDQARTWSMIRLPNAAGVQSFLVHPKTSRVIVTGHRARVHRFSLWMSKDQGKSFDFVDFFPEFGSYAQLYQDPARDHVLYATSYYSPEIFRTLDSGESWHLLPPIKNHPSLFDCSYSGYEFGQLLPAPWNNEIYANVIFHYQCGRDEDYLQRIMLSKDGGLTWKVAANDAGSFHFDPLFPDRAILYGNGMRLISAKGIMPARTLKIPLDSIISVPEHPTELFARSGYRTIYHSQDLGRSWRKTLIGPNERIKTIGTLQSVDDRAGGLLMGNSQGLFYRNFSTLWTRFSKGMKEARIDYLVHNSGSRSIYAVSKQPDSSGAREAITQVIRTRDGGAHWDDLLLPERYGPFSALEVNPANDNLLLAITMYGKLLRSTDRGNTWMNTVDLKKRGISAVTFDPFTKDNLYAGHDKCIYHSRDNGSTLTKISCITDSIDGIVADPYNPNIIFIIGSEGPILKSADQGKHFVPITEKRKFKYLESLGPKDHYIASAQLSGNAWRTSDGGKTWEILQGTNTFDKIVSGDPQGQTLYALSRSGLFRSADAGRSWKRIDGNTGAFPEVSDISDPAIRPLYIATRKGIWKQVQN